MMRVHVSVADLERSTRFYSTIFATDPSVTKPDYAKWMLSDPEGISWEAFFTPGESTVYGDNADLGPILVASAAPCCSPGVPQSPCCERQPELSTMATCCGSPS